MPSIVILPPSEAIGCRVSRSCLLCPYHAQRGRFVFCSISTMPPSPRILEEVKLSCGHTRFLDGKEPLKEEALVRCPICRERKVIVEISDIASGWAGWGEK